MSNLAIVVYGLAAASANFLGGMLISSRRLTATALRYLIALGAGFMLATVFLKIIPEGIELWSGRPAVPMAWFLAGYLLIQLFEHTVAPHFHFGEEVHEEAMVVGHAAMAAVGALMIHAFFDGVSIAAGFLVNVRLGVLIFVAILLHKLPEGFTASSMMLAAGRNSRSARLSALAVAAATFAGALMIVAFKETALYSSKSIAAYALPLSAGAALHVAASDLIPEVNTRQGGLIASMLVFAGVAIFYLADMLLGELHR
jgi:zinc transporter ZupT